MSKKKVGPYKVVLTDRGAIARWRVSGPGVDPMDGYWQSMEHAQDQADSLNVAFSAGVDSVKVKPDEA